MSGEPSRSRLRLLSRAARSLLDPRQPGYLIAYVTNLCNFSCPFCFYKSEIELGQKPDTLDPDEHEEIARRFGPLLQLSLGGGEPFLRTDLTRIAASWLRHTSPRYLGIPTNAWFADRMVHFLEELLPRHPRTSFRLTFSIEGAEARHDALRAKPGSYARLEDSYLAVSPLRERFPNLIIDANTVVTSASQDELIDALRHIDAAFRFDNLSLTYARGDIDPVLKSVQPSAYRRAQDFVLRRRRLEEGRALSPLLRAIDDTSRHLLCRSVFEDELVSVCPAGKKLIVISETGEVRPCEILRSSFGNLRDYDWDVHKLLSQPAARNGRHWIESSGCKCSFECALAASVVFGPRLYPRVVVSTLANLFRVHGARRRFDRAVARFAAKRDDEQPHARRRTR